MLDPLTAISLASAIVQFVDFGSKVVRGACEIYNSTDGALQENADLEDKTLRISQLNDKILQPSNIASSSEAIFSEERKLDELASISKVVARELLSLLHDFRGVRRSGSHHKWQSFHKAVSAQTPWNKEKVQRLESKLKGLQEEISCYLVVMMRYVLRTFSVLKGIDSQWTARDNRRSYHF